MQAYFYEGEKLWPPRDEESAFSKAEYPIKAEEFAQRMAKTKAAIKENGLDGLIVYADGYRPNNVRYLVNYLPPSSWRVATLFIPADGEPTLFIDRPIEYWVKERAYVNDIRESIVQWHGDPKHVTNLVDCIAENKMTGGKIGIAGIDLMPASFFLKIKEHLPHAELVNANALLEKIRIIKSPAEVALIECACHIGDAAVIAAMNAVAEGKRESDVALAADITAKNLGADTWSWLEFFNVVSGPDSSLPVMRQPLATRRRLKEGDLVIADIAAFYYGYCCDFNRMAIIGKPTAEQQRMYDVAVAMEQGIIQRIKPGVVCKDLFNFARDYAIDAGYKDVAPEVHCGHGIGMEVGEQPMITPSDETVLQPGMVIAIEPGLDVPNVGAYRIEDNIVVTEDGCRCLSQAPRELFIR